MLIFEICSDSYLSNHLHGKINKLFGLPYDKDIDIDFN